MVGLHPTWRTNAHQHLFLMGWTEVWPKVFLTRVSCGTPTNTHQHPSDLGVIILIVWSDGGVCWRVLGPERSHPAL